MNDSRLQLISLLKVCGAEKLPALLAGNPTRATILQALAYLRAKVDCIEEVLLPLEHPVVGEVR